MKSSLQLTRRAHCLLTGCAVVGPGAIRSRRLVYNEAIMETNDQQMLMIAIHDRSNERGNLLAVPV